MEKRIDVFEGKKYYLLGEGKDGCLYWVVAPSWDCGWYWGFGYIQTFVNNKKPSEARDISSHQHALDFYPVWWGNSNSLLVKPTFMQKEGWQLAELFNRFYLFKNLAEFYHRGHTGLCCLDYTKNKDLKKWEEINKKILPPIMEQILKILTP